MTVWRTSRRDLDCGTTTLVMGIVNVTPDSFSDGGRIQTADDALRQAEKFVADGADIIDVGGESTRPGGVRVGAEEEIRRIVPVIEAIAKRFNIPISADTTKAEVARRAIEAGAEIINDISALRFDEHMADVAARSNAGLLLMHSRGEFETMHSQEPVTDIVADVISVLTSAIEKAASSEITGARIALDIGIGFGKTPDQNLELIANLDRLTEAFPEYPIAVGTSRKSFISKVLGDVPVDRRLSGSLATATIAAWNGARIIRAHDVKETVEAMRLVDAIQNQL